MIRRILAGAAAISLFGGAIIFESTLVDAAPSGPEIQTVALIKGPSTAINVDTSCDVPDRRPGANRPWGKGKQPPWWVGQWTGESPNRCKPVLVCKIFWKYFFDQRHVHGGGNGQLTIPLRCLPPPGCQANAHPTAARACNSVVP